MTIPLILGATAYSVVMLLTLRKVARSAYYDADPAKRGWPTLLAALVLGFLAALIAPVMLLVIGSEALLEGKGDAAARIVLGEPEEVRDRRLLESKVRAELRSTQLEREVLED